MGLGDIDHHLPDLTFSILALREFHHQRPNELEGGPGSEQVYGILAAIIGLGCSSSPLFVSTHLTRKIDGVHTIGQLLLIAPTTAGNTDVLVHALRLLRFLYSTEKNRAVFKNLFPPDIFANFIDIGNYVYDINAYRPVVNVIVNMPQSSKTRLAASLDAIKTVNQEKIRIREYIVLETLGKGAFGVVYQVKKEHSEQLYALKQIELKNTNADEVKKEIAVICKEV